MSNGLYLSSLALGLGMIVVGAKITEWRTKRRESSIPSVVSHESIASQFFALENDAHAARKDINVGKYYLGVQGAIACGFLAYMIKTGNSGFTSVATATVASMPGFIFAKIKIDAAQDHFDAITRAESSLLLMESPKRLKKN